MKSGTTMALAISLGAAGALVYWLLSRHPDGASAQGAVEQWTTATDDLDDSSDPAARDLGTRADAKPNGVGRPQGTKRNEAVAGTPLGAAVAQGSQMARTRALFDLAEHADVAQLRVLVAQARTLDVPADRRDAVDILLLHWFELDPRSAPGQLIDATLAESASLGRSDHLTSIARAWAQVAAPDAWAYAARISDDVNARSEYESAVLSAWGEREPERALQSVIAMPGGVRKDRLLQQAAANLARIDPRRALEVAAGIQRVDARHLIMGIVTEWAEHDVRAAAQWLAANPGRVNRGIAGQFADRYGAVNPQEAIAWAQKMDRTGMRGLVGEALAGYAEHNPQEALRMALALDSGIPRRRAIAAVLGAIAQHDPAYAMENLDKVPEGQGRIEAVMAIGQPLVRADPRAAVEWLKQLDDREARRAGLANVASMLASSDPDTAASLLEAIPAESRMQWIAAVAGGMAQADPEAATRWIRTFQSEPGYSQVASGYAQRLNRLDAQAAFEFASSVADTRQRDQIFREMMSSGPMTAPEVAARWLDRISDDRLRANAAANIATTWAWQDAAAARKWVTALETGPIRDQALASLVGSSSMSLEDTSALLGQIQSSESRLEAVWTSAMRLSHNDIEAARTLIRRHPLDPRRREMLATQLREQYGLTL